MTFITTSRSGHRAGGGVAGTTLEGLAPATPVVEPRSIGAGVQLGQRPRPVIRPLAAMAPGPKLTAPACTMVVPVPMSLVFSMVISPFEDHGVLVVWL